MLYTKKDPAWKESQLIKVKHLSLKRHMKCLLEKGHLGRAFTKQQQKHTEWVSGNTVVTLLIEDFHVNSFHLKGC